VIEKSVVSNFLGFLSNEKAVELFKEFDFFKGYCYYKRFLYFFLSVLSPVINVVSPYFSGDSSILSLSCYCIFLI
jgi:hypothetical protein